MLQKSKKKKHIQYNITVKKNDAEVGEEKKSS